MTYELIREYATGLTGSDEHGMADWLEARLELDPRWPRARCACIHWQSAANDTQEQIGAYLGFSDPSGGKWDEAPLALRQDYDLLAQMVGELSDI